MEQAAKVAAAIKRVANFIQVSSVVKQNTFSVTATKIKVLGVCP